MRRTFLSIAIASTVGLATAGSAWAQAPLKKVTIVIGSPGLIYSLHYVAVGAGLFAAEGLDVETVQVSSGTQQIAAVLGGSAIVVPTNIEHVIRSSAQGGDMVAVSRIYDTYPYVLVLSNKAIAQTGILPKMPIDEKVRRLKSMKIGITSVGSGTDSFLRSLFSARGLVPDKEITIQPLGSADGMLVAMERGLIDGFAFIAPHSEIPAQKGYGKVVIDPISGEVPELKDVPYLVVTTSRKNIATNPEAIKAITRAYTRAIKFTKDDPQQARLLVRKNLGAADQQTFDAAFKKYLSALPPEPVITSSQVDNMVRWMNYGAPAPIKVGFTDVVVSGFAADASKSILGK